MHRDTHRLLADLVARAVGLSTSERECFVRASVAPDDDREVAIAVNDILGDSIGVLSESVMWGVEHGPCCAQNFRSYLDLALGVRKRREDALGLMGKAAHFVGDLATPFHHIGVHTFLPLGLTQGVEECPADPLAAILTTMGTAATAIHQFHPQFEDEMRQYVDGNPTWVMDSDCGLGWLLRMIGEIPLDGWDLPEVVSRVEELRAYAQVSLVGLLSNVRAIHCGAVDLPAMDVGLQLEATRGSVLRVIQITVGMLKLLER